MDQYENTCRVCGRSISSGTHCRSCPDCGGVIEFHYELAHVRLDRPLPGIWRFIDLLPLSDPAEIPPDHPLVTACQRAAAAILGQAPPLAQFPDGTDAMRFQAIGNFSTLASFGPGQLPLAHSPNEWVSLTSITQSMRMYARIALAYGATA